MWTHFHAYDLTVFSLPLGLTGILFPTQSDSAYSAQRIWLAVGFTLGYIIAKVLDFHSRLWFMLVAVVLVLCCSLIIEVVMKFTLASVGSCQVAAKYSSTSNSIAIATDSSIAKGAAVWLAISGLILTRLSWSLFFFVWQKITIIKLFAIIFVVLISMIHFLIHNLIFNRSFEPKDDWWEKSCSGCILGMISLAACC